MSPAVEPSSWPASNKTLNQNATACGSALPGVGANVRWAPPANGKPLKLVTLGQLLDSYQEELPPGAKEDSTLYTEGIHLRHLKRLLKVRQSAVSLTLSDLQGYVNKRLRESRHGKPIRSDTIKKEIATLRVAWN